MHAYFTVAVNLDLPNDYRTLDGGGKPYSIWNRYSVELPPSMEEGSGYLKQLQTAGELWRLAIYEDSFDSNGDSVDRPALPEMRDDVDYENCY